MSALALANAMSRSLGLGRTATFARGTQPHARMGEISTKKPANANAKLSLEMSLHGVVQHVRPEFVQWTSRAESVERREHASRTARLVCATTGMRDRSVRERRQEALFGWLRVPTDPQLADQMAVNSSTGMSLENLEFTNMPTNQMRPFMASAMCHVLGLGQ